MLYNSIKKQRIAKCFIDATYKIIESSGVDSVTNRGVGEIAGYNSATIYNYFENLDHLIFMASMKFIKVYSSDLLKKLEKVDDPLDRINIIWDTFCNYSFKHPDVYRSIFFTNITKDMDVCFKDYYLLYPEDMVTTKADILDKMFSQYNIYDRGRVLFDDCVEKGYFNAEDIDQLSDRIYLIYEGILFRVIRGKTTPSEGQLTFQKYFSHLINSYRQDILPPCKGC